MDRKQGEKERRGEDKIRERRKREERRAEQRRGENAEKSRDTLKLIGMNGQGHNIMKRKMTSLKVKHLSSISIEWIQL